MWAGIGRRCAGACGGPPATRQHPRLHTRPRRWHPRARARRPSTAGASAAQDCVLRPVVRVGLRVQHHGPEDGAPGQGGRGQEPEEPEPGCRPDARGARQGEQGRAAGEACGRGLGGTPAARGPEARRRVLQPALDLPPDGRVSPLLRRLPAETTLWRGLLAILRAHPRWHGLAAARRSAGHAAAEDVLDGEQGLHLHLPLRRYRSYAAGVPLLDARAPRDCHATLRSPEAQRVAKLLQPEPLRGRRHVGRLALRRRAALPGKVLRLPHHLPVSGREPQVRAALELARGGGAAGLAGASRGRGPAHDGGHDAEALPAPGSAGGQRQSSED
mmetsp:Transcript_36016/g.99868  ORF Transcript_36016/g.99868 Transcript_36016/m.99868 type:complete len:330 (+) Transcript_36016:539-1528(+)